MFELDGDYHTKLDFGKTTSPKVAELIAMEALLLDEVSMLDKKCFEGISEILSIIDHSRRPGVASPDPFGSVHLLLFGDFKQLPPASSEAPFIVLPCVHDTFDFRCLRQNRRVVKEQGREAELENFHQVLSDISMGVASNEVRQFVIDAYTRGAKVGNAENAEFEGNTAVMTKRRYRDRWNRIMTRRVSKKHNHTIKIKAKVRARGTRSQHWYPESRVQILRKKCRTQSLWNLQLAGDWHHSTETIPLGPKPHMMRCMLISNLAVDQVSVSFVFFRG